MSKKIHLCKVCKCNDPLKFKGVRKNICRVCFREQERNRIKYKLSPKNPNIIRDIIITKLNSSYGRAKEKNMKFDLDFDFLQDLLNLQENKCAYTRITFNPNSSLYSMSIDRIDSKGGYTKDNVQWVCSQINIMKMDLIEDDFLFLVKKVYNNRIKTDNSIKNINRDKYAKYIDSLS